MAQTSRAPEPGCPDARLQSRAARRLSCSASSTLSHDAVAEVRRPLSACSPSPAKKDRWRSRVATSSHEPANVPRCLRGRLDPRPHDRQAAGERGDYSEIPRRHQPARRDEAGDL
jgi:hypothetical protein